MRTWVLTAAIVLGCGSAAAGQESRFAIGPVTRVDKVSIEGGAGGGTSVAGVQTTFRIFRTFGVEAEVTAAKNRIARSYEGHFGLDPAKVERDFQNFNSSHRAVSMILRQPEFSI